MGYTVVPSQKRLIGLQWKKWMKASDPSSYKGCVIFLLTLYKLYCSGLEPCRRKMEDGGVQVGHLVRRKRFQIDLMCGNSSAVLLKSSLVQMLLLLMYLYPSYDHPSMPEKQFCYSTLWTRQTCYIPFPSCVMMFVPHLTYLITCLSRSVQKYSRTDHSRVNYKFNVLWTHFILSDGQNYHLPLRMKPLSSQHHVLLVWNYILSFPLPCWKYVKKTVGESSYVALQARRIRFLLIRCHTSWLRSCLSFSSLVMYGKCVKRIMTKVMILVPVQPCSFRRKTALRLGVLIVFVNQMLLIMAGDVEPNPGPGNLGPEDITDVKTAIFAVKHKWYNIGQQLNVRPQRLKAILDRHCDKVLELWQNYSSIPPTVSDFLDILESPSVGEKRLVEDIRRSLCSQDGEQARGLDQDILCAVQTVMLNKLYGIGQPLGIPPKRLEAILEDSLINMLNEWLRREQPLPTWSELIQAMASIGEEKIAQSILRDYCGPSLTSNMNRTDTEAIRGIFGLGPHSSSLERNFKKKAWLSPTTNLTEEQLVKLELGGIEQGVKQYGEFEEETTARASYGQSTAYTIDVCSSSVVYDILASDGSQRISRDNTRREDQMEHLDSESIQQQSEGSNNVVSRVGMEMGEGFCKWTQKKLLNELICLFCFEEVENLKRSHIVPKSVLHYLCKWKARVDDETHLTDNQERKHMYMMTKAVSAAHAYCKFLCHKCEERFQRLDNAASGYWKNMSENWAKQQPISHTDERGRCEPRTNIVLFSIMIRAMYLSLDINKIRKHQSLLCAFRTWVNDKSKWFLETTSVLNNVGFLCHFLPLDDKRTFRVEFPFFCALEIDGQRFEVICAQVPPFFCILPEKILPECYLPDIIQDVHLKLQIELEHHRQEARDDDKKIQTTNFFDNFSNGYPECLLYFPYLDREQSLEVCVTVHEES